MRKGIFRVYARDYSYTYSRYSSNTGHVEKKLVWYKDTGRELVHKGLIKNLMILYCSSTYSPTLNTLSNLK